MKTKHEIIDEIANYYNSTNRSYDDINEVCKYKGPNNTECAFQRCVETNLSEYEGRSSAIVMERHNIRFKDGYEGHDIIFWRLIQNLHDSRRNWNEKGLSDDGQDMVNKLKTMFDER
jgi:hypothetical protein